MELLALSRWDGNSIITSRLCLALSGRDGEPGQTDGQTWKIDYFYSQQAYSVEQRFLIVLQMQVFYILLHILYVISLKDVF